MATVGGSAVPASASTEVEVPALLGASAEAHIAADVSRIPVIDLSLDEVEVAEEIRKACVKYGFFTIKNHGVDEQLVEAVFRENKNFFALPLEQKMEIAAANVKHYRGYTPMKDETLDPKLAKAGDAKEGVYFGREISSDDPEAAKPLTGPNQWPPEELLPTYRTVTEAYMAAMATLGLRLVHLIALALGCPRDYFDVAFSKASTTLRPLHYSSDVSNPTHGLFGAGAHTDYGMLTILKTGEEGGLQLNLDGCWLDIEPNPRIFICNIGDMLERWSNGLFRSTLHRVLGRGRERYSVPFFYDPHVDTSIECLPQCCSPSNPAKYPPTTSGQHILDIYSRTHASYKPASVSG